MECDSKYKSLAVTRYNSVPTMQSLGDLIMSKCAGCDQHNAVIYHDDDMYCEDCYQEKLDIEKE